MRHRPLAVIACALYLVTARTAAAYVRDRIALVIENRSTSAKAVDDVAPLVSELLTKKRYDVVPAEEFEQALARDAAGVPTSVENAARAVHADAVLSVTIDLFLDARERQKGPSASAAIAVSARMFAPDGRVLWRNSMTSVAEESVSVGRTRLGNASNAGRRPGGSHVASRSAAAATADTPAVSAASMATEVLLWTLPRGRPSPEELAAMRSPGQVAGPAPQPLKSTRLEKAPDRLREATDAARFPIRNDRRARTLLDRTGPRD